MHGKMKYAAVRLSLLCLGAAITVNPFFGVGQHAPSQMIASLFHVRVISVVHPRFLWDIPTPKCILVADSQLKVS
jgi:hypothetical protein